jgi:hypothetical protein
VYRAFAAATADSLALADAPAAFAALPQSLLRPALLLKLWRAAAAILKGPPPLDVRLRAAPARQRPAHGLILHAPWPKPTYVANPDPWLGALSAGAMTDMADVLGAPAEVALRDVAGAPLPGASQALGRLAFAMERQEEMLAWLALEYGRTVVGDAGGGWGALGQEAPAFPHGPGADWVQWSPVSACSRARTRHPSRHPPPQAPHPGGARPAVPAAAAQAARGAPCPHGRTGRRGEGRPRGGMAGVPRLQDAVHAQQGAGGRRRQWAGRWGAEGAKSSET